jgi:hypothetical protein
MYRGCRFPQAFLDVIEERFPNALSDPERWEMGAPGAPEVVRPDILQLREAPELHVSVSQSLRIVLVLLRSLKEERAARADFEATMFGWHLSSAAFRRKPPATTTPSAYSHRARRRLYPPSFSRFFRSSFLPV